LHRRSRIGQRERERWRFGRVELKERRESFVPAIALKPLNIFMSD
jgi:hypothetical protein